MAVMVRTCQSAFACCAARRHPHQQDGAPAAQVVGVSVSRVAADRLKEKIMSLEDQARVDAAVDRGDYGQ